MVSCVIHIAPTILDCILTFKLHIVLIDIETLHASWYRVDDEKNESLKIPSSAFEPVIVTSKRRLNLFVLHVKSRTSFFLLSPSQCVFSQTTSWLLSRLTIALINRGLDLSSCYFTYIYILYSSYAARNQPANSFSFLSVSICCERA